MIVTLVYVRVINDKIEEFIEACKENHRESIKEKGNLRFDILQDANDASKFTLYEAYKSEIEAAAHKNTDHYLKWRETVADWMAEPRKGIKHNIICPKDISKW